MTGLLEIRMEALRANLTRLAEESEWKSHLGIAYENVDNDLWQAAFDNIYRRTRNALKKLDDIRAGRATKIWPDEKAWIKYREVYLISQALFQECLELQGGLAMRDRKLDREICQMADELIKECARVMVQKSALAIPAQAAALSTTLSRIARVRFPEWDVWTLPLVAHEYGHFAIGDYDELKEFVGDTGQDWQALAVPGESDVERRVRTLVADGFATYTTGPAYVCALVLLRLSPFDADLRSRPENCQRARMVFATVKKMDKDGLYESLMRKLHEYWDDSLAAVQGAGSRTTLDDLDLDAGLLIDTFDDCFRPVVPYTPDNWMRAMEWSRAWRNSPPDTDLPRPDLNSVDRLRDVLNAAWHARMQEPELTARIAQATRDACEAIRTRGPEDYRPSRIPGQRSLRTGSPS